MCGIQVKKCLHFEAITTLLLVLSVLTLSAVMEHTKPEQIDFGTTIHTSFDEFKPIHISF